MTPDVLAAPALQFRRPAKGPKGPRAKALTPNDFATLDDLAERVVAFGEHYRAIARPFEWTFTRADLGRVLAPIADREPDLRLAA